MYSSRQNLRAHLYKRHKVGKAPNQCECGKGFAWPSLLSDHRRLECTYRQKSKNQVDADVSNCGDAVDRNRGNVFNSVDASEENQENADVHNLDEPIGRKEENVTTQFG